MKKAIICTVVFLLCLFSVAYAYQIPEISITDVNGDVITISGAAESDVLPVSLVILNPGYTKESLSGDGYDSQTKAIQTFKAVYPIKGKFSFEVPMKDTTADEGGGIYTVYITEGETEYEPISYRFYFQGVKLDVIKTLNDSADISTAMVEDIYQKYGLEEYALFKDGDLSEISSALESIKNSIPGKMFAANTAAFDVVLKEAALLGAYNASKTDILTGNDGYLNYDDLMGITALSEWKDYKTSLSSDGVKAFNKDLIGGSYGSISAVNAKFRELIAYYGIIKYKEGGFGHFDYFFDEYEDVYDKYDFNFSDVKSSIKNKVYKDVLNTKTNNIEELADKFNEIVDDYLTGSEPSGSKGGKGTSVGAGVSVAPTVPEDSYIVPEIEFNDLDSVEWARSAIMYLADKGIVVGKAKNTFAPNDLVTRGEFVKMLTVAFDVNASNPQSSFADADGHWAEKYIAAAVEAGIASGVSDTAFAPNMTITREMGAAFAARALTYKGITCDVDDMQYDDHSDISSFAIDSVYGLKKAGVMSGTGDNIFCPQNNMTRAEAARIIYALMIYAEEVGQ